MIKPLITLGLSLGLTASVLLSSNAAKQGVVGVGDKPAYSFNTAPANSMGIKSLEELKGRPVLIEFWGTQ